MTPLLEEIQDRLSSYMGKNRNEGGKGVLSRARERKVNGDMASSICWSFQLFLPELVA